MVQEEGLLLFADLHDSEKSNEKSGCDANEKAKWDTYQLVKMIASASRCSSLLITHTYTVALCIASLVSHVIINAISQSYITYSSHLYPI